MHAPIPPEVLVRYGKIKALADHPSTPAPEATAAQKRLATLAQEYPGLPAEWDALKRSADRATSQGPPLDWEGLWKGDPRALQALMQVLKEQQRILREGASTSSSRSPIGSALDNMVAAGMDWLTAQINETVKEIPMARQKKDRHAQAGAEIEEEELQIVITVDRKGHTVIKIDCPPEDLEDLLQDRDDRRAFIEELRGQLAALSDASEDDEEEDDDSSSG